jgi:hypothetical protein
MSTGATFVHSSVSSFQQTRINFGKVELAQLGIRGIVTLVYYSGARQK